MLPTERYSTHKNPQGSKILYYVRNSGFVKISFYVKYLPSIKLLNPIN